MKTIQEIKSDFEQVLSDLSKINGMTPESSVQVATVILQESGKFQRTQMMNGNSNSNGRNYGNGGDKPITEKQRKFMQDLGITVTPNMTSREASKLIDQSRSNGKGGSQRPFRSFQR